MNRRDVVGKFRVLGILSVLFLAGCGGGTKTQVKVPPDYAAAVHISPMVSSVQVGMTQQFSTTVSPPNANQAVTWSLSGVDCSGSSCGTIDAMGNYTAPSSPHLAGITITATSVETSSQKATATAVVTPRPTSLAVSPNNTTVPLGGAQQFIATGNPLGTVPVVSWNVSGSGCVDAACGTIDSDGKYEAPNSAPNPALVRVTATSSADRSVIGSATVLLGTNANRSKLNGHYAFLLSGYDSDGNGQMAGSFTANGNGTITSGVTDYNYSNGFFVETNLTFTGTYSVGDDNRGSITIVGDSTNEFIPGFTQTFTFALSSFEEGVGNRGRIIELDDKQTVVTGILAKQDPAAFSTKTVSGNYALGLTGTAVSGFPLNLIGRFTASDGTLSSGLADIYGLGLAENGSGTVSGAVRVPFSGIYTVSANGRGTALLHFAGQDTGISQFSFYVVSATELLFIETDMCTATMCTSKPGISGEALQQARGPFGIDSLNGRTVFTTTEPLLTAVHGSVTVGEETFDGNGTVTGTEDMNKGGEITAAQAVDGTYTVDADGSGRGTIYYPGRKQTSSFYLVSPGKAFVMDTGSYEAGMFEPKSGEPFANDSISGNYVLGTLPLNFNWAFTPNSGVVTADGSGGFVGVSDGNDGTGLPFSGGYSVSASGRTTMTITPATGETEHWVFYVVSPSKIVGIDVDSGRTNSAIRILEK